MIPRTRPPGCRGNMALHSLYILILVGSKNYINGNCLAWPETFTYGVMHWNYKQQSLEHLDWNWSSPVRWKIEMLKITTCLSWHLSCLQAKLVSHDVMNMNGQGKLCVWSPSLSNTSSKWLHLATVSECWGISKQSIVGVCCAGCISNWVSSPNMIASLNHARLSPSLHIFTFWKHLHDSSPTCHVTSFLSELFQFQHRKLKLEIT